MRFLIPLLIILLVGASPVSAITVTYSGASPTNNTRLLTTNVVNYSIDYTHAFDNTTVINHSLISISLDGTTYVNYTTDNNGTATCNSTSYYWVEQSSNSGNWIYYRYYTGNDTTYSGDASGIYQYRISRFYAIPQILTEMVDLMWDVLSLIVSIVPIIIVLVIVAWLKGWFKGFGKITRFK